MADQISQRNIRDGQTSATPGKKSGCVKAILIVGCLTLLMTLCCAGIVGGIAWSIWPTVIEDPVGIAALGQQILAVTIPPEFEPTTGFKMDNFAMSMQMAAYRRKDGKGSLVLGSLRMKVGNAIQKPEFHSKSDKSQRLKIGETKVRNFQVREQSVPFRFSDAVDQESNRKFRVVETEFEAQGESKFFKLVLEEEAYDEESAVRIIESIR